MNEEQNGMTGGTTTPVDPEMMAQGQVSFAGAQVPGHTAVQAPKKKKLRNND